MAKVNNGPIPNLNEDWGRASSDGLPYSGNSVQEFIKKGLKKADEASEEKIGYSFFNPEDATLYHFKNEAAYREWVNGGDDSYILTTTPISFEGKLHQIEITPISPNTKEIYFTKNAKTNIITTKVESFSKAVTDKSWEAVDEYIEVTISIDAGGKGEYKQIKVLEILSGKEFSIDVKDYLASGYNRLKINTLGKDTGTIANYIYSVTLTSMYLVPSNFNYAKPFIEGKAYSLGGMNIGGDLDKTLHIKVTRGEIYTKEYEIPLGTAIYPTFAYTFDDLEFPVISKELGGPTGVYHVDIWLDAFGVKSDTLSYNIMCISAEDEYSAQLVAISDVPDVVYNHDSNALFHYYIYNKGSNAASPTITLEAVVNNDQIWELRDELKDVDTGKAIKYERSITIESIETNIQLIATIEYGENIQQAIYKVDNSKSYPAEQDKLQFYLNPAMRSNNLDNKDKIINTASSTVYNAEWTKMSWTEDGWVTDNPNPTEENPGRACLYIPAYSKVVVDYKPLNNITQPVTLEFAYKVANTSNYDDPIITICNDLTNPKFTGIKITPKNVLVHNKVKNSDDKLQDYNLMDEEFVHIVITIIPNYKTNYGNICQIYCNGAKVRSFEFSNISDWDIDAPLILGNNTADLYLYKFRVYGRSFDKINVKNNYLNSLDNTVDKEIKSRTDNLFKSCTDDSGNIDYNTCVNNGYNTMVIEMLGGDPLPDKLHQDKGQCNLTINIHDIPEGELDPEMESLLTGMNIINQDIEGQGTTAMTYTRWNFRWKLGSDYGKRRITAKKNVASSMHSHKMGATRLFNYLHTKCVGKNEAGGNVAVYQYPVYGFQKIKKENADSYEYKFIGLYTIGADKGDKITFGYNNKTYAKSLIHMEGSDHTPKSVGFDYPWDHIKYEHEQERGINTYDAGIGAIQSDDHIVVAWELGMAGENETDNPSHNDAIKNLLDKELEPAYNVVYKNSPLIIGVDKTLSELNSDIENWQANISEEGDEYRWYEFWLKSNYNLCFYNQRTKQYEYTGVNMKEDLDIQDSTLFFYNTLLGRYSRPSTDASDEGKQLALSKTFSEYTLEEQNQIFISERQTRFANNWDTYWHKDDCIFNYTFILLLGLTDNFKKNTYPYKFPLLKDGGKWRWRGDDFDTLFDINNQGLASKGYSILVGEKDSSGSIYAGDNSAFYKLLRDTQKSEIKSMVNKIFSYMVNHPKSKGANTQEKLVSCIKYFFWDFAQNYFPSSAYNSDAEWTYEEPWADKSGNSWKEVHPLNQSLGGHYEAEKDWVTMRMLFCSSYFNFGAFQAAGYADTSTGQLVYDGAAISVPYKLKPAIDLNPTIIIGGSETVSYGDKVKAGTIADMPISGGANTRIYIQGLDWITDLGDLAQFTISSKNPSLTIASKRLQRLKLGDSDANLMAEHISNNSTIESITFGYCPSIELIDCQNLSTLAGTIDLTQIPRLQKALLGGTSITELKLPAGAKLDELQLPDTLNTLELKNLKFLTTEGFKYNSIANVSRLVVEGCDNIDSFALLRDAYNNGTQLKYIRLVGFNYNGTSEDLDMLANIASNKNGLGEDWQYQGVNNVGVITEKPVLEGVINIDGYAYEDSIQILERTYGANLTINLTGGYYIRFEDPAFNQLVADAYGDGDGITQEQADTVTRIVDRKFVTDTTVTEITDLYKFRNLKNIGVLAFGKNVTTLCIPDSVIGTLPRLQDSGNITKLIVGKGVTTLNQPLWNNRIISEFVIPDNITKIEQAFDNARGLKRMVLGKGVTSTAVYSLRDVTLDALYIPSVVDYLKIEFNNTQGYFNLTNTTMYIGTIDEITEDKGIYGDIVVDYDWDKLEQERELVTTKIVNEALEGVSEIKRFTFYGMTQLEGELVIPDNVTSIGSSAFYGCSGLTSVTIGNSVTSIGNLVFYNCINVADELTIPPSVTTLGNGIISNTNIKKLYITLSNIQQITNGVFVSTKLEEVHVDNISKMFNFNNHWNFGGGNYECVCKIYENDVLVEDIIIEYNNGNNYVQPLAQTQIKTLKIDEGFTTIPTQMCYYCRYLTKADLPSTITEINSQAFAYSTIKTLICRSLDPPSIGTYTFLGVYVSNIYVPDTSVEAYKTATGWSEYASKIKGLSEYTES